jgi:hypothetical protein
MPPPSRLLSQHSLTTVALTLGITRTRDRPPAQALHLILPIGRRGASCLMARNPARATLA